MKDIYRVPRKEASAFASAVESLIYDPQPFVEGVHPALNDTKSQLGARWASVMRARNPIVVPTDRVMRTVLKDMYTNVQILRTPETREEMADVYFADFNIERDFDSGIAQVNVYLRHNRDYRDLASTDLTMDSRGITRKVLPYTPNSERAEPYLPALAEQKRLEVLFDMLRQSLS